jgi:hypothetical protein
MLEKRKLAERVMDIELVEDSKSMLAVFGDKSYGSISTEFYQKLVKDNKINIDTQVWMLGMFSGLNKNIYMWESDVYAKMFGIVKDFYSIVEQVKSSYEGIVLSHDLKILMFVGCLLSIHEEEAKKYFPVNKIVSRNQVMTDIKVFYRQIEADFAGMLYIITTMNIMIGMFGGRLL